MRCSLLCRFIITFVLLSNLFGSNADGNPGDQLQVPEDGDLTSSRNSERHLAKHEPHWDPGRFGLERGSNRNERRKQKKLVRRKERQERRERRKNRHHLHASKPQIPIIFPRDPSPLPPAKSKHSIATDRDNGAMPSSHNNVSDMGWLESNITSIWLTLQYIQKDLKQLRRQVRRNNQGTSKSDDLRPTPSPDEDCPQDWAEQPDACTDDKGLVCGGKGKCSCGQCLCEPPHYGIHCHCNDMVCDRNEGVLCGGAGRGQCRCGACVCRPGFTGSTCECSVSTSECRKANGHTGRICSGNGDCVCNRCQCQDGFTGKYCDESIYSASICEKLKPCVLCIAYGKKYPQCEECNISVQSVDELASSRETCLMVHLGCILKYAYVSPETKFGRPMTVLVNRDRSCP